MDRGAMPRSGGKDALEAALGLGPIGAPVLRAASVSVALLASLALVAAGVRVLPWLMDSHVPWRVALPFARAIASVALEAAVLVGWPIGCALGAFAFAERGEARVLALLGERPIRTALRLAPIALVFGAALAVVSLAGGRDASEPGRVVAELLAQGRASCGRSSEGAVDVPIVGATWLCAEPRLVGAPPFAVPSRDDARAVYTAKGIDVSPDARRIALDDAWLTLPSASGGTRLHVARAVFSLPPFVRASALAPAGRAALLAASGGASSILSAWLVLLLVARRETAWRLHAIALGGGGPVAALTVLHALERADAQPLLYLALPVVAVMLPGALALVFLVWRGAPRLPRKTPAASP
jgi:hypothetical protein